MLLTFIQPSIEIGNLQVDEPITTLTDLLLAMVSFYAFYRLGQQERGGRFARYLRFYFLCLGLGALTGGLLGHAFLYRIAPGWKLISWVLAILSVSMMIHAMIEMSKSHLSAGWTRLILTLNWIVMPVALFLTLWRSSFSPVTLYTIYGMLLVVGSLSIVAYLKTGCKGAVRFLLAVGLGLISALVFSKQWSISPWFTHSDISHSILDVCALLCYKGGTRVLEMERSRIPVPEVPLHSL